MEIEHQNVPVEGIPIESINKGIAFVESVGAKVSDFTIGELIDISNMVDYICTICDASMPNDQLLDFAHAFYQSSNHYLSPGVSELFMMVFEDNNEENNEIEYED
jgi:hypothetical protein